MRRHLDNDMQNLNSLTGPLSAMTVNSSDSNAVSASAASGSSARKSSVVVNSLATTASWTSGNIRQQLNGDACRKFHDHARRAVSVTTITTDGTETLSHVASEINSDNLGVTASVITDATAPGCAMVSNSSGTAANFTVASSGSTDLGLHRRPRAAMRR